jgi:two-component system chemotaxis response regulator CheY
MAQVLVVDDDQDIRETIRFLLEDAGHEVFEAQDGLEALKLLQASPHPMVVLLDFMMPRLDGAGVLGTVAGDRYLASCHRYILMTAVQWSLPQALNSLLKDLAVPVLFKPLDIDQLLDAVDQAACCLPSDGLAYVGMIDLRQELGVLAN